MNVRTSHGLKVHKDIPTSVALLLQELGLVRIVIDAPAPGPQVTWGIKEVSTGKVIVRNDGVGGISFHDSPPADCPESIAVQLDRPSQIEQAHADSVGLERARNNQPNYEGAQRWKFPFTR